MNNKRLRWIMLLPIVLCVAGCQATRTASHRIGQIAVAVPLILAGVIIDGIFDSDETDNEESCRKSQDRQWKQYWREHPNTNPAMHEAFKDDYE